ncbi:hypothetical protein [Salegentibacter sp. Hel_I_6]|uniref:hypothetical protein n=1 Tax=Salegentibacter sp. Hel_I_6 TaxID=1250278 RepID=UPI00056A9A48|nr:hypothetical protein [Salegentibacter sp. Hel_I_6]
MNIFKNSPSFIYLINILIIILLFSCSTQDDAEEVDQPTSGQDNPVPFDITAIAKSKDSIYQIDILENNEEIEVINLSQSLDLPLDIYRNFTDDFSVTFVNIENGNYEFWQKDVRSGTSKNSSPICSLSEYEGVRFVKTDSEKIGVVTVFNEENNVIKNYLNIYDHVTSSCNRFYIGDFYIQHRNYTQIYKDRFYLYSSEPDQSQHSLSIFNIDTGEQIERITSETEFRVTMNDEQLFLMFINGQYSTYNLDDLSLEKEGQTNNQYLHHSLGIQKRDFKDNKMVFDFTYPQPSPLASAPAIYDWTTNEITKGGNFYLADAKRALEDDRSLSFNLTKVKVNLDSEILVAGYEDVRDTNKGGVVYLNFDGEIILDIPLDYAPYEIIIRE